MSSVDSTLKQSLAPILKPVGYGWKRSGFEHVGTHIVRSITFVKRRSGSGVMPRLAVILRRFYDSGEMTVTATHDLAALVSGTRREWYSTADLASLIDDLQTYGLGWLETVGSLDGLAEHLESTRYFPQPLAGGIDEALETMGDAGVSLSEGIAAGPNPVAPRLRTDVIEQLSYCYESMGDWQRSLAAWREYCTIFRPSDASEFLRSVGARLNFLEERAGNS